MERGSTAGICQNYRYDMHVLFMSITSVFNCNELGSRSGSSSKKKALVRNEGKEKENISENVNRVPTGKIMFLLSFYNIIYYVIL
jgi:hypothetical protein